MSKEKNSESATMDVHEAAEEAGVGVNQMYASVKRNEVPHVKFGKRIKILTVPFRRMLRGETAQ